MSEPAGAAGAAPSGDSTKDMVAGVFDRAAATYDRSGVAFFGVVGDRLVELAEVAPGEHVLDLGCGTGAATLPAAERVGPSGRVLGLDLAPGMVQRLTDAVADAGLRQVTVRVGDAERPDAPAGEWDVVLASLVLFFLPHPAEAFLHYRSLLRDGGRLAFSWFGPPDPRWRPAEQTLAADLPDRDVWHQRTHDPFANETAMATVLAGLGYTDVHTRTETVTVRYPDRETWWRAAWSHGQRAVMERLEQAGLLEQAVRRTDEVLQGLAEPDGSLLWHPTLRYTIARS